MTNKTVTMSRELAEIVERHSRLGTEKVDLILDLRALLAAPVAERQPVAWLVTDIHGQKKALRVGAEGIERHRNSGSTLVPLFDYQPSQVAVDDGWYTDECGNIRYRPEESPPAPVASDAAKAFAKGFNTLETDGGKYKIVMQFTGRDDAWSAYTELSQMTACLDKVKEMNR